MVDRLAEWVSTGAVLLPVWAVIAGLVVIVGAFAFMRAGFDGRGASFVHAALVVVAIVIGWWMLDQFARRDRVAAQDAVEARALELATRALAPGSALACLDAIAGDVVEEGCAKALFASPEATAGAVSYVAAQLALVTSNPSRRPPAGPGSATDQVRRAIEADRFGIVAHVLAVRDGCTPDRCGAFASLQDASRVRANLADRPFEARVKTHSAGWQAGGSRPVAGNLPGAATSAAAGPAPKALNNLYFPSSSSIPPVNIMTAEPAAPPPHDTTGASEAGTPPRKPSQGASQARQPSISNNAPARSAPMQLAPSP